MSPVLDHVTLGVSDFENTGVFYDRIMPTLGFKRLWGSPTGAAYGVEEADDFGLIADDGASRKGTHVALRARD